MGCSIRYIVSDVDAAISFYTQMLGFNLEMHPAPGLPRYLSGRFPFCSISRVVAAKRAPSASRSPATNIS